MAVPLSVLILGASYGALLATKLALAGHRATLVCLPAEAELIRAEGLRVRLALKGRPGKTVIDTRTLPGRIDATTPAAADPSAHDLVALAMQEPQYREASVRDLLARTAAAGTPVLSIMNMPPLTFLARLPGVDTQPLRRAYADATVWDLLAPERITLASPDPQAFRPPGEPTNVLEVTLPTNFKVAPFADPDATAMLARLEADIEAARLPTPDGPAEVPVKLKLHPSLYVPLAKWCMLLTGNYRCIGETTVRSIREAVHDDRALSAEVYGFVMQVARAIGAEPGDLVAFEKYAAAAEGLSAPSSAARALAAGARAIERVDLLVQTLGRAHGLAHPEVDATVARVDAWLDRNRAAAA